MPDYNQSKIYKIINEELPNLVYYGSTTRTLNKRLSCHNNKFNRCSSKALFSVGTPEIILLENYPCETKEELLKRERYWIEGNQCVNHCIPYRTQKETIELKKQYQQYNKEQLAEYYKQWIQDNKQTLNKKFECECGGQYTHKHITTHFKTKKHKEFISLKKPFLDANGVHQN
jgi:hypothetical protein